MINGTPCYVHIQVASALSTICSASSSFSGVSVRRMTRSTSPIVRCNRSQIAFNCGFFTVVGTDFIPAWASSVWNSCPRNSPPLSWTHLFRNGYRANQQFWNWSAICWLVLLFIRIISARLVTVSIQVRALNSTCSSWISILHGPIRSTATSSQGTNLAVRAGSFP